MTLILSLVVGFVFIGSQILAISTPIGQLTPYRILVFLGIFITIVSLFAKNKNLKLELNKSSGRAVLGYAFLWGWALITGLWAVDTKSWVQAVFLLTLGIGSICLIYFWINNKKQWEILFTVAWLLMSVLLLWGYFEIITNRYYFADLGKLDKHGTFSSQPMTRIPITVFSNQNDYATMLLAYIATTICMYHISSKKFMRLVYVVCGILASYLIYRSGSRMSLLCLFMYLALYFLFSFKLDLKGKHLSWIIAIGVVGVLAIVMWKPDKFLALFDLGKPRVLSGDAVRISVIRNGLLFLAKTFGLGLGAGNIERWMAEAAIFGTKDIVNIHNWWFEILVAYGLPVFMVYVGLYIDLSRSLYNLTKSKNKVTSRVSRSLLVFMLIFIFASMTSANNILIEWHWVFFALIISYIKLEELDQEVQHELIYTNQ